MVPDRYPANGRTPRQDQVEKKSSIGKNEERGFDDFKTALNYVLELQM
jgi:hypothetical protein